MSLKFIELTFDRLKKEVIKYLQNEYSKSNILFTNASPYGQILNVIMNLHQLSMLYLKNSIKQFDLSEPNSLNEKIIKNAAIFAGHIPTRAISSTGVLKFTLKPTVDIEKDIPGGRITFNNKMLLKNNTNGLEYSLNIGSEKITYEITHNMQIFMPIIQGKWVSVNYTGSGEPLQSISINLRNDDKDVENYNVEVYVNGEMWNIKKHLYDLLPNENACVIRTGFNGGIDVLFGNNSFGRIPKIGDFIQINYLETNGSMGNLYHRKLNDWNFVDMAIDGNGNTIDPKDIFDISIQTDINFGADAEDVKFTKSILPLTSNNFVLGTPQQYAYELKKLGVFSHVNAYEHMGVIYIVATPNIKLFKNRNANYFKVDLRAFTLDEYEKRKIDKYIKTSGNIQLSKKYVITSPKLSFYVINIFLSTYTDVSIDSLYNEIIEKISDYFLNLNRMSIIPKSDIIDLILTSKNVYSVDVQFISKKNEDYHMNEMIRINNIKELSSSRLSVDVDVKKNPDYDPNKKIGIDPILGDIIFEPDELPIIRGGWYDRNGVYYSDDIEDKGLKSVNLFITNYIDPKNRNI